MAGSMSTTEQIGMWLLKADSSTHDEERQMFYARAAQVAARNSIDLAEARAAVTKGQKREEPTQKRVTIGKKGQVALAFYTELMLNIAGIHDLKCVIYGNGTGVGLYGFPSDIEVTEAIYASAVVGMVRGGDEYLKAGEYKKDVQPRRVKVKTPNPEWSESRVDWTGKCRDSWGDVIPKFTYEWTIVTKAVSGMTARQNFYDGFVNAVTRKMREAKREVEKAAKVAAAENEHVEEASSSTALVLVAKKEEVQDFYDKQFSGRRLGHYNGGSRTPVSHSGARAAGARAGANANVGGRSTGIGGSRTAIGR